jgi:hypothetical protein
MTLAVLSLAATLRKIIQRLLVANLTIDQEPLQRSPTVVGDRDVDADALIVAKLLQIPSRALGNEELLEIVVDAHFPTGRRHLAVVPVIGVLDGAFQKHAIGRRLVDDRCRLPSLGTFTQGDVDRILEIEIVVASDLVGPEPRYRIGESHVVAAQEIPRIDRHDLKANFSAVGKEQRPVDDHPGEQRRLQNEGGDQPPAEEAGTHGEASAVSPPRPSRRSMRKRP